MDQLSGRWNFGLWVGKRGRNDEHAVLTLDGVQQCRRCLRRRPDLEQRGVEVPRQAIGLLQKLDGKSVHEHEATEPTLDVGDGREQHVTKRMVTDTGPTIGCPRCNHGEGSNPDTYRKRMGETLGP